MQCRCEQYGFRRGNNSEATDCTQTPNGLGIKEINSHPAGNSELYSFPSWDQTQLHITGNTSNSGLHKTEVYISPTEKKPIYKQSKAGMAAPQSAGTHTFCAAIFSTWLPSSSQLHDYIMATTLQPSCPHPRKQEDKEGQGKGPPNSLSATCVDKGVWKMWLYIWVHCYIHQYRFSVTKEDQQNGPQEGKQQYLEVSMMGYLVTPPTIRDPDSLHLGSAILSTGLVLRLVASGSAALLNVSSRCDNFRRKKEETIPIALLWK